MLGRCPLLGVKRTFLEVSSMSVIDPKRTLARAISHSRRPQSARLYLRASFPLSITTMTEATSSILGHYGAEDLVNRIMRALAAAGYNTVSPTAEMLNLIDQLHGGGLNSTKVQAEMAGVAKDMRILDAGCV